MVRVWVKESTQCEKNTEIILLLGRVVVNACGVTTHYILVVAHTKNPRSNTDVNDRFYILRGTQMYVLTSNCRGSLQLKMK